MGEPVSLLRGNALALPLADGTVDLIVTSPPYFALRSYTDDGQHYPGQLGSEDTPAAFVDALIEATREMVRVLKPSGSIWVNLGDKYAGGGGQWEKDDRPDPNGLRSSRSTGGTRSNYTAGKTFGFRHKSLMGLPWRYALRCIDDLGLILRAEVIWAKPNGLPESVTDRVRRSHEQWFHFTKEPRYFSAVDEIREPHKYPLDAAGMASRLGGGANSVIHGGNRGSGRSNGADVNTPDDLADCTGSNPLGKLPGSVWTIPTEPLRVPDGLPQHFAAFPSEWPRRIILGWSPSGVCETCGEGRRPVVDSEYLSRGDSFAGGTPTEGRHRSGQRMGDGITATITGYSCGCPTPDAPTTPARVLDPFAGTGTTVAVANALGRHGIGVDLSADYLRLARWRCEDPALRAKVLGVDKPKPQIEGQLGLLEGVA